MSEDPFGPAHGGRARQAAPGAAARQGDADEGGAHRRALLGPGVDLRAQARRHPLRGDQGRQARAAAVAQRPQPQRPLPGDRRRARARRGDGLRGRRRGRRVRGQRRRASAASPSAESVTWRSSTTSSTCPTSPGTTRPRCRCGRARRCCAARCDFHGPVRLTPHRNRDGEALLPRGVPQGVGGRDRQARRRSVHARALARLAEVQVLGRAGARDRRVHRAARLAHRPRRAARRPLRRRPPALRGQGRHRLHARHAARPRRAARRRCAATDSPFADEIRERSITWVEPRARGPGRASRSGRATGGCATRASSGCATTRTRARWSARGHDGLRQGGPPRGRDQPRRPRDVRGRGPDQARPRPPLRRRAPA